MNLIKNISSYLPESLKNNLFLKYFGLTKVPMILFVNPSIVKLDSNECVIKIGLNKRTKNHLNSMYFGVLHTGADISGGIVAMNEIVSSQKNISLSFKDFKADFLKRAEGDVHFVCRQVKEVKQFVSDVIASGERMNYTVKVEAFVPSISNEIVANFELTLSLKLK